MPNNNVLNVFVSRRERLKCYLCNSPIEKGEYSVGEDENSKTSCFKCSPFKDLTFLPSGDAALSRRSKTNSSNSAILQEWNNRRRRYERRGIFVESQALLLARAQCAADSVERAKKRTVAAEKRKVQDAHYIKTFSLKIREFYPSMPKGREKIIAEHACEKYSGRVGRTAAAKEFSEEMITKAVIAHIRHHETDYDDLFGRGKRKRDIRQDIRPLINNILNKWQDHSNT